MPLIQHEQELYDLIFGKAGESAAENYRKVCERAGVDKKFREFINFNPIFSGIKTPGTKPLVTSFVWYLTNPDIVDYDKHINDVNEVTKWEKYWHDVYLKCSKE